MCEAADEIVEIARRIVARTDELAAVPAQGGASPEVPIQRGIWKKLSNWIVGRSDESPAMRFAPARRAPRRTKGGQTVTKVFASEAAGAAKIASVIELGSTIHADEAPRWDALHDRFLTKRINHEWAYSCEGA